MNRCPECGGEDIYAQLVSAFGGYGPDLLPNLGALSLFKGKNLEMYICGRCGYIRFFVPEERLPEIREKYQKI